MKCRRIRLGFQAPSFLCTLVNIFYEPILNFLCIILKILRDNALSNDYFLL